MNEAIEAGSSTFRPQRWDEPFGPEMTAELVDELLEFPLFKQVDPSRFPKSSPLREILLNDARIREFDDSDIVMREGDYGDSAFLVLDGSVRIFLERLPAKALGRHSKHRRGWIDSVFQALQGSVVPERRAQVRSTNGHGARADPDSVSRLFVQDLPRPLGEYQSVTKAEGELFGELAALGRTARTATIIAAGKVRMLEIRWQGLREIRNYAPEWKKTIDELFRKHGLQSHLRTTALLSHLSPSQLESVSRVTEFESFGNFDWHDSFRKMTEKSAGKLHAMEPRIISEGEYPNHLILVRSGFVRVSHQYSNGVRTSSYLGKGQHYGMAEILHSHRTGEAIPYKRSLHALGYVDILMIPTPIVEEFIIPSLPDRQLSDLEAELERLDDASSVEEKDCDLETDEIEFLVENRFINGTAAMLINMDRCTRCDDCVRACATTHDGNPRFIRQGKQMGSTMIANSCMHCTDPVCMIGCPTGAINRASSSGEIVINDLTCIGCTTCANSCPYNNIHMVETRSFDGSLITDEQGMPIVKATKCDLCFEQIAGPSCQRACPHDALARIDMRKPQHLVNWLKR